MWYGFFFGFCFFGLWRIYNIRSVQCRILNCPAYIKQEVGQIRRSLGSVRSGFHPPADSGTSVLSDPPPFPPPPFFSDSDGSQTSETVRIKDFIPNKRLYVLMDLNSHRMFLFPPSSFTIFSLLRARRSFHWLPVESTVALRREPLRQSGGVPQ